MFRRSRELDPENQDDHWIPLSDLMTGLMMIFLLVAVSTMTDMELANYRIKRIAVRYNEVHDALYQDLEREFHNDLPRWGAELHRDLSIRFREPDVLFATGSDVLKPRFAAILGDFFPRYVAILSSPKYRKSISEIRIEGHTSSFWNRSTPAFSDTAYFDNMALSQARTRSTLAYVLELPAVNSRKIWLKALLTANGLSSSRLIFDKKGRENVALSQRVEFRVRTDAASRIARIVEISR
jgi:outer membrane protein OmpA-like peptidoglycan-associated protein